MLGLGGRSDPIGGLRWSGYGRAGDLVSELIRLVGVKRSEVIGQSVASAGSDLTTRSLVDARGLTPLVVWGEAVRMGRGRDER